jgi:dTDP-4-dehydrorhamnose reductase
MRVLVIGASGLLGQVLLEEWHSDEVSGVSSQDGDLRSAEDMRKLLIRYQPACTVLAAAYTDVDGCEKDPQRAHEVNCLGPVNVALAARGIGSRLVFLSSDYVFDGSKTTPYTPEDRVSPINVYGRSKAEAEQRIREILPECCVVRTSWLFGAVGRCFPNTILQLAQTRKPLSVVDDQCGCPTWNRDLARAVIHLARLGARGIVHVTNEGYCTWYEFAKALVHTACLEDANISPVSTAEFPRPARRPGYSVLSKTGLEAYGIAMRPWRDTLPLYEDERQRHVASSRSVVSPGEA